MTPKLTVTLGVRYEFTPPFSDRYRGVMNVKMFCTGVDETGIDESCRTPVLVRPGEGDFHEGLGFHIADNVPKETGDNALFNHSTIQKDRNDWAPRVGFAYQLNEKTTVRTGYGVFYAQDTGNPVFDMGRNFGARESARSLDVFPTSNIRGPWDNKGGGATCSDWDGPCFAGLYTFGNTSRRRTPYIHQYMFNVQRQLTDTMMVEVGYMGNAGHKLQRMFGYNTPTEKAGPTDLSTVNQRRPWGGDIFGRIQTIGNVVNSNYNALAVKVQQRYSSGFTYLIGYTWAKAIDNGSAIRTNAGDNLFPASSYDRRPERGPSQFDTNQRFTASILYEIPLKFQNKVLETLAGGWQLGTILTLSSGTPINGGTCGDRNSNGQGNRGDLIGDPHLSNPTPQEFYAKRSDGRAAMIACQVIGPDGFDELTYRQGNRSRNIHRRPNFSNWDFSLMKNFRFGEKYNMQFRYESFNFTNHPQWNNPNTNPRSINYGVITSARQMRTNQFALKFIF